MVNPDRNLYDPPYDDALLYDNEMEPERPRSRSLVVMLAFVVLAAFAGVVWVAYNQGVQQGQRGVNPPLLSADAGPTRIEPDQSAIPAANPAPEKSYERLWATNTDHPAGTPDTAVPGTEAPRNDAIAQGTVPSTQDVASAAPPAPKKQVNQWAEEPARGGPLAKGPAQGGAFEAAPPKDPNVKKTIELTGEIASPAAAPDSQTMTGVSLEKPGTNGVPREIAPPIQSAPVPTKKPKAAPVVPAAPIDAPVTELQDSTPTVPAEVPAASSGKYSIQLGSFPTDALAAAHWSKVMGANQALLSSYKPQFVNAVIPGKGTWWRLRVGGFSDKTAAKTVCDQLIAAGQACILAGK